ATVTLDEILDSCETFSMFSEKRVIWVRDFQPLLQDNAKGFGERQLKTLEAYMDEPNDRTVLIFSSARVINDPKDRREKKTKLDKLLLKKAKCYDFCPLDRKALRSFIEKRIRTAGAAIGRDEVEYLIDTTGYFHKDTDYRLMNLEADLAKITGLAQEGAGAAPGAAQTVPNAPAIVNRQIIDRAILGDMETYVFDFLDHLAMNRKSEAFTILSNMMADGNDVFGLLGLMVNHFELITEVKELREAGMDPLGMAKELGIHEFRVKKALTSANRTSLDKLKSMLCQLYDVDAGIKRGDIDGRLALELFIGRI
ncbi:MAG: hypothetical protein II444_02135, partial [Firmicutes bacterium]|nr:hypothetical protein [Bacillota bacterium]